MLRKGRNFNWGAANREDGRLAPQNNQFIGVLMPGSFIDQRERCIGKTQRDWVEREVGGGIMMGNACKSMADSCQCMTKTTTK